MKTIELNEEENNQENEIKENKLSQINEIPKQQFKNNFFSIEDIKKKDEGFAIFAVQIWDIISKNYIASLAINPLSMIMFLISVILHGKLM